LLLGIWHGFPDVVEEKGTVLVCYLGRALQGTFAHVGGWQGAPAPFPFSEQRKVHPVHGIPTSTVSTLMCGGVMGGEEYFN